MRINGELNKKKAAFFRQTEQIYREQIDVLGSKYDVDSEDDDVPRRNIYQNDYMPSPAQPQSSTASKPSIASGHLKGVFKPPSRAYDSSDPMPYEHIDMEPMHEPSDGIQSYEPEPVVVAPYSSRPQSSRTPVRAKSGATDNVQQPSAETRKDDVLAAIASGDISDEAALRLLKAKTRVMQEELDALSAQLRDRESVFQESQARYATLSVENGQLSRTNQTLTSQAEKQKATLADLQAGYESEKTQKFAVEKELEQLKRANKQLSTAHGALEVRLNRAKEESDRMRLQMASAKSQDASDDATRRLDEAQAENKKLQKQKTELIAAFKKQMQLIQILKRQKLHVEAAKLLSFTEEEFLKTLDWGQRPQ